MMGEPDAAQKQTSRDQHPSVEEGLANTPKDEGRQEGGQHQSDYS
jgi:hypothetical protein